MGGREPAAVENPNGRAAHWTRPLHGAAQPTDRERGRALRDYAGGLVHELREGLAEHVLEVAGDELPEGPRSRLEQSARSSGRAWGGVYAARAGLSLRRRRSLDFSPDLRGSSSRRSFASKRPMRSCMFGVMA